MRRFKIVLILLSSVILFSCTQNTDLIALKKGKAIVTGNVENWQQGSGVIRFSGKGAAVNEIEQTAIIDSLGNFRIEVEMYHPQNVNFSYEKGFVGLYLKPSDSLFLKIDSKLFEKDRFPVFNISGLGKAVVISKNINEYMRFRGESAFNPDPQNKSVDEFLEVLKQENFREDSILQVFCQATTTTPEFRNWAKNHIKYGVANYIISYRFINQGNYAGDLFDKELFPVDNDAAIVTSLYGHHLRHFALNLGLWQDSVSMDLLKNKQFLTADIRCLKSIISKEKQGLSRDIMCYKIMVELFNTSFDDFEIAFEDVGNYIDNQTLKDILQEKKEDFISQKDINITFFDPKTKEEKAILGDLWAELSAKYIGKVVYVDIWATWCGPCKGEIPHAIDLQEFYKGKEIAFVNLCLASDKSEWERMIVNGDIHGGNYFFNEPQAQLLRDKLKFEGYPTYLIIDKQGNLINTNAPRPSSDDEIKSILNELIRR